MRKFLLSLLFSLLLIGNVTAKDTGWQGTTADDVKTNTLYFDNRLSSLDDDVQKALETLEESFSIAGGWTHSGNYIYPTTITDNVGIGTTAPLGLLQVGTSPNPPLIVKAGGNVGIGTTNPSQKLDLARGNLVSEGKATFGDTYSAVIGSDGTFCAGTFSHTPYQVYLGEAGEAGGFTDGFNDVSIVTSAYALNVVGASFFGGNVGIGNTAPQGMLDVGTSPGKGLIVKNTGNVGIATTNPLYNLQVNGTFDATTITQGGLPIGGGGWARTAPYIYPSTITDNVGIGLTNPSAKLQVVGNILADTGTYTTLTVGGNNVLTSVAVTSANGFTGTSSGGATPSLTLTASPTGILKSNGTTMSACSNISDVTYLTAETDPGAILTAGTRSLSGNWNNAAYNITTLGNVGIGITNPTVLLQAGTNPNPGLIVTASGNVGVGTTSVAAGILQVGTFPGTPLIVLANGNVGVGTTAPGFQMEIAGPLTCKYNGAVNLVYSTGASAPMYQFGMATKLGCAIEYNQNVSEAMEFMTNGTAATNSRIIIKSDGNTGIGTIAPVGLLMAGSGPTPGLIVTGQNGNVGIGTTSPKGLLQVGTAPGSPLVVLVNGNVGIGITLPGASLDIAGKFQVDSNGDMIKIKNVTYAFPADDGEPNEFLQTNGSGTLDWAAGGAGSQTPIAQNVEVAGYKYLNVGNIGIGISDPGTSRLAVMGGNVGIGSTAPKGLLQVGTEPNTPLTVLATGNVGLGTTNPIHQLDVVGTSRLLGNVGIGGTSTAIALNVVGTVGTKNINGHTFLVGASGYTTISTAMSAASAGDTILVEEGTYTEAVTFGADNITLKALGSKENTTITQADASYTLSFGGQKGCVVEGFTISQTGSTAYNHNTILATSNTNTVPNIFRNCKIAHTGTSNAYGMKLAGGTYEFYHCDLSSTQTATDGDACQLMYALTNAINVRFKDCKITTSNSDTSAHGTNYGIGDITVTGTVENIEDCIVLVTSAGATTSINNIFYVDSSITITVNIYNSYLSVVCSSTGTVQCLRADGAGATFNSYHNIYVATNTDNDGLWASIPSGSTLNSYNDRIIDGTLAGGGTIACNPYIDKSGNVGIATTAPVYDLQIGADSAAKPGAGGLWTVPSDLRLKDPATIKPYTAGLDLVTKLNPVYFHYNTLSGYDTSIEQIGFVAQDMTDKMPSAIKHTGQRLDTGTTILKDGKIVKVYENDILGLNIGELIYADVNAIKELKASVDDLNERLKKLEKPQ